MLQLLYNRVYFIIIRYYQPYFDVDQVDVKNRLILSIKPHNDKFFEETKGKPDLYLFNIKQIWAILDLHNPYIHDICIG